MTKIKLNENLIKMKTFHLRVFGTGGGGGGNRN